MAHLHKWAFVFIVLSTMLETAVSHQAAAQTEDAKICTENTGYVAMAAFTRVLKNDPNSAEAYYNRGVVWRHKGEYDRAIADFNEAIRLDPQHANSYKNRGALNDALLSRVIQIDCSFATRENRSKHQQAIVARCRKILNAEKIEQVTDQQIAEVVQLHYPDIRQTLNELQLRFCMPKAA